jgi:hypothetical protein
VSLSVSPFFNVVDEVAMVARIYAKVLQIIANKKAARKRLILQRNPKQDKRYTRKRKRYDKRDYSGE